MINLARWFFAVCLLTVSTSSVQGDVKLPTIIDSHMVLQQEQPISIWGWADEGEEVSVSLAGKSATAKTNADGKWLVRLPALKASSKPLTLTVEGKNTIQLEDILVGEVWIGSGQSNMEWPLTRTQKSKEAIAAANHPQIRLFHVPKVQKPAPADNVNADWRVCTTQTIPSFSAVLYYYGRKLHEELEVPVGLINSSWGGSPIEPWTIADGKSGGMYNGMIAPLQPCAVQGAIWYQGETNVLRKNGLAYYDRMNALIGGWRKAWDREFPFYFVQIAPWGGRYEAGQLPALWEGQVKSLKIPGTGMAVTTDLVDNINDIHPQNKLDVGNRLARWALAKTYGNNDVVYSGPLFKSAKVEGGSIRLSFAHVADGLKSRDGKPLSEFQIAGADGETVVVSAEGLSEPKHVRFGWHKVTNPNLVNSEGLPASPFQTNNWQGGTGE